MDPRLETNRANWNDRVDIHVNSDFYDVPGWLRDAPSMPAHEVAVLGDVTGLSLVHLQCHFGMDTLRMARAGARVTGLDFSPVAIEQATRLAQRSDLAQRAEFVCADVYDAPTVLSGRRYDVVYVNLGSLCWLPDVVAWGEVVGALLAPDGRLYLHDVHPLAACLDDDGERITYSYFTDPEHPLVFDDASSYTDGASLHSTRNFQWIHSLSDIVASVTTQGLSLDSLVEHEWTEFRQFPYLVETRKGRYVIGDGRPRIPLSFTLLARRRA